MAKNKPKEKVREPTPEELTAAAFRKMQQMYEVQLDDKMGKLHNQLIAYVSQAQIPLPHLVLVLDLLKDEAVQLAKQKYMKAK